MLESSRELPEDDGSGNDEQNDDQNGCNDSTNDRSSLCIITCSHKGVKISIYNDCGKKKCIRVYKKVQHLQYKKQQIKVQCKSSDKSSEVLTFEKG